MEISAFGVVHKSFKKLNPKLGRMVEKPGVWGSGASMDDRIKGNYAISRQYIGQQKGKNWVPTGKTWKEEPKVGKKPGLKAQESIKESKAFQRSMVTAAGNRSKRKGRVLP